MTGKKLLASKPGSGQTRQQIAAYFLVQWHHDVPDVSILSNWVMLGVERGMSCQ
jgi:hypothetical protein